MQLSTDRDTGCRKSVQPERDIKKKIDWSFAVRNGCVQACCQCWPISPSSLPTSLHPTNCRYLHLLAVAIFCCAEPSHGLHSYALSSSLLYLSCLPAVSIFPCVPPRRLVAWPKPIHALPGYVVASLVTFYRLAGLRGGGAVLWHPLRADGSTGGARLAALPPTHGEQPTPTLQ